MINNHMVREYILYACPLGDLAAQIERYMVASRAQCGPNQAHAYMPHCTLTGFFHDEPSALPATIEALDTVYHRLSKEQGEAFITVREMMLTSEFHGLLLEGEALKALAADFATHALSPTRRDAIRLKDWLHLSLAYGFPPEQHEPLAALARELVDPQAQVGWSLRFYERHADEGWICHREWTL